MIASSFNLQFCLDFLDYVPFLSTPLNLYHIFHRSVFLPVEGSSYSAYLLEKDLKILILSLVPFANILAQIYHNFFNPYLDAVNQVKMHAGNFEFVNPAFQDDYYLAHFAISNRFYALQWASNRLKHHKKLALHAVKRGGHAYFCLPENLKNNKEIALNACENKGDVYLGLPAFLKQDFDVVKAALSQDGGIIQLVPEPHHSNRELNLLAVKKYADVFPYLATIFQEDELFIEEAILQNHEIYDYLADKFKTPVYLEKFAILNPRLQVLSV